MYLIKQECNAFDYKCLFFKSFKTNTKFLMYLIKQKCNAFNYKCRKNSDHKVFLRYNGKFYNN